MEEFINILTTISPIIVAFFVGFWGLFQKIQEARGNKPKTDAEALEKIAGAAGKIVEQYQEILEEFKKEKEDDMKKFKEVQQSFSLLQCEFEKVKVTNKELEDKVDRLIKIIVVLAKQMKASNLIPEVDISDILKEE